MQSLSCRITARFLSVLNEILNGSGFTDGLFWIPVCLQGPEAVYDVTEDLGSSRTGRQRRCRVFPECRTVLIIECPVYLLHFVFLQSELYQTTPVTMIVGKPKAKQNIC